MSIEVARLIMAWWRENMPAPIQIGEKTVHGDLPRFVAIAADTLGLDPWAPAACA